MRALDLGCGPGSITAGIRNAVGSHGVAIGVDLDPGPGPLPFVRADAYALPFADASFDAVFACAVLQHLPDPLSALVEARRVARPGAAIGIADADWGGVLIAPGDPLLDRGQEIAEALRPNTSPYVGRELRGLLSAAGFIDVAVSARGGGGGGPDSVREGEFQAAMFDTDDVIAYAIELGVSTADEMKSVAQAWRRWGHDPGAVVARHWFEATGRVPH